MIKISILFSLFSVALCSVTQIPGTLEPMKVPSLIDADNKMHNTLSMNDSLLREQTFQLLSAAVPAPDTNDMFNRRLPMTVMHAYVNTVPAKTRPTCDGGDSADWGDLDDSLFSKMIDTNGKSAGNLHVLYECSTTTLYIMYKCNEGFLVSSPGDHSVRISGNIPGDFDPKFFSDGSGWEAQVVLSTTGYTTLSATVKSLNSKTNSASSYVTENAPSIYNINNNALLYIPLAHECVQCSYLPNTHLYAPGDVGQEIAAQTLFAEYVCNPMECKMACSVIEECKAFLYHAEGRCYLYNDAVEHSIKDDKDQFISGHCPTDYHRVGRYVPTESSSSSPLPSVTPVASQSPSASPVNCRYYSNRKFNDSSRDMVDFGVVADVKACMVQCQRWPTCQRFSTKTLSGGVHECRLYDTPWFDVQEVGAKFKVGFCPLDSKSPSPTNTKTATKTPTVTKSFSPTNSPVASVSAYYTPNPNVTESVSPTISVTRTPSISVSYSSSRTPTESRSPSSRFSRSHTSTALPSPPPPPRAACEIFNCGSETPNVLTLEDFTGFADTGGQIYVGGDTVLSAYTIGAQLSQSYGGRDDLVVGGTLEFKSGECAHGNIVYGNDDSVIDSSAVNSLTEFNELYQDADRFDFAGAFQCYNTRQLTYCGHHDTGLTLKEGVNMHMIANGYNRHVEVFSVTCEELAAVNSLIFDNARYEHTTMLINVHGDDCSLHHTHNWDPQYIVFSFCEATTLQLKDNNDGAILAPNADVTSSGMVNGQIVVKSFIGDGQQNYFPFEGCLPGIDMDYAEPAQL